MGRQERQWLLSAMYICISFTLQTDQPFFTRGRWANKPGRFAWGGRKHVKKGLTVRCLNVLSRQTELLSKPLPVASLTAVVSWGRPPSEGLAT